MSAKKIVDMVKFDAQRMKTKLFCTFETHICKKYDANVSYCSIDD